MSSCCYFFLTHRIWLTVKEERKTQKNNFSLQIIQFFINRPKREQTRDLFALWRIDTRCLTVLRWFIERPRDASQFFYFTFHSSLSHSSERWLEMRKFLIKNHATEAYGSDALAGQLMRAMMCGITLKLSNNLWSFSFTQSFQWIIANNCWPKSKSIISWVGGSERGDCGSSYQTSSLFVYYEVRVDVFGRKIDSSLAHIQHNNHTHSISWVKCRIAVDVSLSLSLSSSQQADQMSQLMAWGWVT